MYYEPSHKRFFRNLSKFIESNKIIKTVAITALFILSAVIILYYINLNNHWEIINHPTFTGEVIGKESVTRNAGVSLIMKYTEYRLHISGEYTEDNRTIQIDRTFIVPSDIYNNYNIEDFIP